MLNKNKKAILSICFIMGFLCFGTLNIFAKNGAESIHPRSEANTGIDTSLNGNNILVCFDFSFGLVNTQIKKQTGQVVYSAKTNTDNVNYSLIDITSLTKGSYIITYTDSKGIVIDIIDLTID